MRRAWIWALVCALALSGCAPAPAEAEDGKLHVVATVFPAYDFARAAGGELAEVTMLLPPGAESHSYEPSPADILAVQGCDLFLYLGGESDDWVDRILDTVDPAGASLRMIDCVETLAEETVEGMQESPGHGGHEHEHEGRVVELDEHVWTSPRNGAVLTRAIGEAMAAADPANGDAYHQNAESYAAKLEDLDREFAAFFGGLEDRTIVFGDRFPLRYFAEEYGLDYYAAFPGCSTQTEPSAATVAFLTEKVREEGISTVWYIESSNHLVADAIAEAAGAETAMFHTCHSVSRADLEGGATYLSLMEGDLAALRAHMGPDAADFS